MTMAKKRRTRGITIIEAAWQYHKVTGETHIELVFSDGTSLAAQVVSGSGPKERRKQVIRAVHAVANMLGEPVIPDSCGIR